jgi:hypothetical protein
MNLPGTVEVRWYYWIGAAMQLKSCAVRSLALAFAATCGLVARAAAPSLAPQLWESSAVRARFALELGDFSSRLRVASASVLPGETLAIRALDREGHSLPVDVRGASGLRETQPGVWAFRAPSRPGLYRLHVSSAGAQDEILANVFVLVPRREIARGRLNGYPIGVYPAAATVQGARVEPPRGFIEVTPELEGVRVSPRFRLGAFLCKEDGAFPKYVVLDPRLPAKLEALLDAVRATGLRANGLVVMSGYRTPAYNGALGNKTTFSQHLWGSAADVFIDESPRDGRMDDLDGNGVVDARDSERLFELADSLDRNPTEDWVTGGASYYDSTPAHGPFLHVDVRGRAARW